MKWGRKKCLPSSSSSSSLISHVFPVSSWLAKLKHNSSSNSEPTPRKLKLNPTTGKWNSPLLRSPGHNANNGHGNGKLYGFHDDGDSFWRLSFGQDNADQKSKRVGLGSSVWHDFDGPVSSCPNFRRKESVLRSPRNAKTARELRSRSRREMGNAEKSPGLRTMEDLNSEQTKEEITQDTTSLASPSSTELGQRKSLYVSMEKQRKRTTKQSNNNNRVRAYSPRAETCKVKAIEDMKKNKLKKKKKKKRREAKRGLESFAVVKSSSDPRKDFKESMVEMILAMKMSRPEELEELLACYLTLNSDDHHDLIIKVFREVWLELGQLRSGQVFSD